MDFRFDDEQRALRDAVRGFCEQHFARSTIAMREGEPADPATWRALADMGVFAMLLPPESAGDSGGATYAAIVFEQLGEHLASGPLLWSTIAAPLVPEAATGAIRLAGIDRTGSVRAPYVVEHAAESDLVVVIGADSVTSFATSELPEPSAGEPFDPLTPALAFGELPTQRRVLGGPEAATRLRLAGTVLAAAQLVGVAQGALDVASAYALERHQFGVPIGSFQAVKHMLADMYVRVGLARSATYAAAAVFDDHRAGDVTTAASTAKVLAGEAALANGRTAVQVLGGMGFTWEMTPHYFLKRAWVLEESFGTGDTHALALADALEADARRTVATWT
jgi:alkylation response protein AidB-like acyl-CoA dehydrogenase